jgi:hypothetical protein
MLEGEKKQSIEADFKAQVSAQILMLDIGSLTHTILRKCKLREDAHSFQKTDASCLGMVDA